MGLPRLTWTRRLVRCSIRAVCRAALKGLAHVHAEGLEHLPRQGPAIVVINHLGDADVVLLLAYLPTCPEALASIDLIEYRWIFWLLQLYGVIWIHRGRPDRAALKAALQALEEGRILGLAPEGRQTLIGGLGPGTEGVAYLAVKSGAPVIPIGITGTFNWQVFPKLRRFQKIEVSLKVGPPLRFPPPSKADRKRGLQRATEEIMLALARLLPPEYQGIYRDKIGQERSAEA